MPGGGGRALYREGDCDHVQGGMALYGGHPVNTRTRTHTHMTENITFTVPFAGDNNVKTVSVTIFQVAAVKKVSLPKIKLISFRQP